MQLAAHVGEARTPSGAKPLLASAREDIDPHLPRVERNRTHGLDPVHAEEHTPLFARSTEPCQVDPNPSPELHGGNRESPDTGLRQGLEQRVLDGATQIVGRDDLDVVSPAGQRLPGIHVRRELACAQTIDPGGPAATSAAANPTPNEVLGLRAISS